MKTKNLILLGIIFSLIVLWVIAYNNENGDVNAVSMYFLVYGIFGVLLGVLNGLYLKLIEQKTTNLIYLLLASAVPLGILFVFFMSGVFRLTFIGEFGLIGIGITNFIWIINRVLI